MNQRAHGAFKVLSGFDRFFQGLEGFPFICSPNDGNEGSISISRNTPQPRTAVFPPLLEEIIHRPCNQTDIGFPIVLSVSIQMVIKISFWRLSEQFPRKGPLLLVFRPTAVTYVGEPSISPNSGDIFTINQKINNLTVSLDDSYNGFPASSRRTRREPSARAVHSFHVLEEVKQSACHSLWSPPPPRREKSSSDTRKVATYLPRASPPGCEEGASRAYLMHLVSFDPSLSSFEMFSNANLIWGFWRRILISIEGRELFTGPTISCLST